MIAVTGARGFIGSRLVAALGERAIPLVRKRASYLPASQVEIDLLSDYAALVEALAAADAVVHLAGHNEIVASQEPDRAMAETMLASRHVAEAAAAAEVSRVVYVSTVHVYGARMVDGAVLTEEVAPEPRSVYAIARLASEHVLRSSGDVDTVMLRLTNAVGAPAAPDVNRWTLVAADLSRQAIRTGTMTLRSSGYQWRDFIPLTDVIGTIGRCTDPAAVPSGTYNLGSGQAHTVRDLATLVQDRVEANTGTRPPLQAPDHVGPRPEPYHVAVDRLQRHGIAAAGSLSDAVDELVRFCIENERSL